MTDIFTKSVHGLRLRYAAVGVVFLILTVGLFHLGGPQSFGWYPFISILVLVLMALVLFLLQCHFVLAPIERLTAEINGLFVKTLDATDPLRIRWSGKDEFANLAAAMNGLLEAVQSRSLGALEENRRLKDIVSSSEVELVAMNHNGSLLNVIHCPEGMDPVPGLARGFKPDAAIWGAENGEAFSRGLAAVCEKGGRQTVSLAFKMGGGNTTRRIRAFITRPKNGLFPIVAFRDEERRAGEGVSSDRKFPIARVAAGIASDLKTVFSVIQAAADRYGDVKDPEVRKTIDMIVKAVRSGTSMVEELETLGGELHLKLRHCSVAELIGSSRVLLAGLVANDTVKLGYDLAPGLPDVFADLNQIDKVFVNLVRNSVEAFGVVPGRIVISARPCSMTADEGPDFTPPVTPGEGVLITVTDNGPGMQAHIRSHVFDPYCTTKANGRGLGLAIADSIVAAHGGGMRVTSEKGGGTEVAVFLHKADRPAEDLVLLRKEFPGGEVLAIDDNKAVLRITSALLRTQKIATHVADCRKDAIRKFSELNGRLRAVLLDAQLGDSHSVGLLRDMRAINPNVPVIVVSGYTAAQINSIFDSCPADAFLMKPYTVEELKQVLATLPDVGR